MNLSSTIPEATNFPGGVTVLMSVWKGDDPDLFEIAVRSVFDNSLQPNAFILVLDGPISKELDFVVSSLKNKFHIKVLPLSVNVGLAKALNTGLQHVRTKWVARADADDYNVPNRFELQAAALRKMKRNIDLLGGSIQEVAPCGRKLAIRRTVEQHADILRFAEHRNPFNHMTMVFKTELAVKCGGYPNIYRREDYALWAEMLAAGACAHNLPDILVVATTGKDMYRRRGGLTYAFGEIALQRHLVRLRLKSLGKAILHGSARAIVFVLPWKIRQIIYEQLLRSGN